MTNPNGVHVPPPGEDRREWIRAELRKRVNPATNRRYWAADIGRAAGVGESTVSLVYKGRRVYGDKAAAVRAITAEILGIDVDVLFPEARDSVATCPKCAHTFALSRRIPEDEADEASSQTKPTGAVLNKRAAAKKRVGAKKREAPKRAATQALNRAKSRPVGGKVPGVASASGTEGA